MEKSKDFFYGVIFGILGVILFSAKAVMVKLGYRYNVDAISMLLLRMLFAFPFYLITAIIYTKREKEIKNTQKDYLWLVFFGFVGYYLASLFDFIGLQYIKASLERVILFIYPTIVLLLNRLFLKKEITKHQKLAILVTYIGILLAFGGELNTSGSDNVVLGAIMIVLSAITFASYLVGSGWLIPKFGVMRFTAYAMLVSCISVFIHYGLTHKIDLLTYPWQVYVLGLCIAFFSTVIPSFLVSIAIKKISSSNFAVISGLGPISTIILAVIFLDEKLTWLQIIGTLVVISGILIISRSKKS